VAFKKTRGHVDREEADIHLVGAGEAAKDVDLKPEEEPCQVEDTKESPLSLVASGSELWRAAYALASSGCASRSKQGQPETAGPDA
jgi:hypothetical protein